MKFTKNQSKAIKTFGKNLSVSAGAGSGKTTVLVNKYSQLIEQKKALLSEILAITFTNKAALDMQRRVRELINSKVDHAKTIPEQNYWKSVKNQLDTAHITTIHSFGLNVLKNYPLEAQIHPESGLMDEIQSHMALQDVIKAILATEFKQNNEIKQLVSLLGSSNAVIDALLKVYLKSRSLGGEPTAVAKQALNFNSIAVTLLDTIRFELVESLREVKEEVKQSKSKTKFVKKWQNINVDNHINTIKQADSLLNYEVNELLLQLKEDCSRPPKELADLVKSISNKSKNTGLVYDFEAVLAYFDALPIWHKISDLIAKIHYQYSSIKRQRRLLDYSDLEWQLLNLLASNERIRQEYQTKFKYLMVDEFQDTSPLQQTLIKYLAPYHQQKLFIVGDARQSIYRFRAAEVEGFMEMEESIKNASGERIVLAENFRSEPQLINFFNSFFAQVFAKTAITYDIVVAGKQEQENQQLIELWLPEEKDVKNNKSKERHEIEAKIIANNIVKMQQSENINFGDIAILFRALSDVKIYERQLQKQNIPYVVVGSRGFFAKQEVLDILNLLNYFVYNKNTLALVGILRSPLFGLSDESLYYLASEKALLNLTPCNALSKTEQQLWLNSLILLKKWRTMLTLKPVSEVMQMAIDDTNYLSVLLGSLGYGLQAVANVEKLINTIINLEQNNIITKVNILRYLEALKDSDAQFGEATLNTENKNAVQIMTVHQSKGLEFNTVIIAQCERESKGNQNSMLEYSKEYGLVVRRRNWQDKLQKNIYYNQMKDFEKRKELEESYRLLYVAATRAEHKLIFSAAPDNLPMQEQKSWLKLLVDYLDITNYPQQNTAVKDLVIIQQALGETYNYHNNSVVNVSSNTETGVSLINKVAQTFNNKPVISASALIDFSSCPKLFYFKNILKIPTMQSLDLQLEVDNVLLGDIVHKVCEITNNKESLFEILNKVVAQQQLPQALKPICRLESEKILQKYHNSELLAEISQTINTSSEIPFSMLHESYVLSGVIDKVLNDNNLKIIDFKSGSKTKSAINKYKVQIALYALAIKKQFKKYPQSLIIYFMMSGNQYNYINELKDEISCINLLNNVILKIDKAIKNNKFEKQEELCAQCKYKILCKNYN
ncbi:UvrD-helicase domain-containing protein [Clostridium sp. 'deep sea']|uniref:UvrD-helicase domain-containing protein n=1 Tax=Clostridium sp. 'deep sea' TaxID=2779445 RepID=UPI00189671EE|nr:UvrD-helicase domain-containing protein [Clostridium sp. 'deep sea']QOR36553.1 UvrD-helicase domain-containing protein [Clostridium sp. 'deep sea']